MVWVPPGSFLMGATSVPGESLPQHQVTLTKGFWMDRYEVSRSRYSSCVTAGVCPPPSCCFGNIDDRAVRGVSWEAAGQYCAWAGKRLPTEAEWEHAGCGDGVRCYPWGGDKMDWDCTQHPDCSMAAFCPESLCANGPCYNNPQPVTAFESANVSPYGVVNMGGNVWEWVQDSWTPNFEWCTQNCVDPLAPQGSDDHVMKGGGWISEEVFLRCAARYHDGSGGFPIEEVGIRCVADP